MKALTTPLSLLGAALVLAGGLAYLLNPGAGSAALANVGVGAVLIIAAGALNPALFRQYGRWLNAFWGGIMVLGIVVMLNFLADRYPHRLDVTKGKLHSLAELSRQTLASLQQDVEATAFVENGKDEKLAALLKGYAVHSPHFSFELVDPVREPERAQQAGVDQYGTLVLRAGGRQQKVTEVTEKEVTNALLKLLRDRSERVYLTVGHGEVGLGQGSRALKMLKARLEETDYALADSLFLARAGRVPDDCSLLLVAGPRSRFLDNELQAIRRYLDGGGALLALLDPGPHTGLEELLADYGVIVGDDFVIDTSGIGSLFGLDFTTPIAVEYGDHAIAAKHRGLMTFYQVARSVRLDEQRRPGVDGAELVRTSSKGWAEADLSVLEPGGAKTVRMDPAVDRAGPVPLAVAVSAPASRDGRSARLVVFGDADFATDQFFGYQGNGDLVLNAVSWLVEDEALIAIRPREAGHSPIALTGSQARWVFWITVVFMPVAVALAGMLIVSRTGRWSMAELAAAGVGVVLSLGVVAVVNFLGDRYHHRLDLTAEKLFTLDRQTVNVLRSLEEAPAYAQVKVFLNETAGMRLRDLLTEYRYRSRNFDFEFVDPQRNALAVKQYGIREPGTSIVEVTAGGRVRTERASEPTEEALTNAIRRALEARHVRVCFTAGHGEGDLNQVDGPGFSILRGRLAEMNLEIVDNFRLGRDELRVETDLLAVLGPKSPFAPEEIAALRSHVDRGGRALLLLDPATRSGVEAVLADLGIAVGNNFVVDLSGLGQIIGADVWVPVVINYGKHAVTERIGQGVMSFFPLARSVAASPGRARDAQVTPLVFTDRNSWGESDLAALTGAGGQVAFDPAEDLRGPISLAVAATVAPDTTQGPAERARMVVFGDTDFATNQYFGQQANGELLVGSMTWLAEGEKRLQIAARRPRFNPINLVGNAGTVVLWVAVFIVPFAVALSGLVVVLRRAYWGSAGGVLSWLIYTFAANALFLAIAAVVRLSEGKWMAGEGWLALALAGAVVVHGLNTRSRWVWKLALVLAVACAAAGYRFIPHDTIKLVYAAVLAVNAAIVAWVRGTIARIRG